MITRRTHSRGEPFNRDIPDGCKSKSQWEKEGFILKPTAKVTAWILMMDNYHEFAVFNADQVMPGKVKRPPRKTFKQLEKLFLQYKAFYPDAELYGDDSLYWINIQYLDVYNDRVKNDTLWLSGYYNQRSGRAERGSLNEAYEELEKMIAKSKAEREKNHGA